jgi:hypothetical protein
VLEGPADRNLGGLALSTGSSYLGRYLSRTLASRRGKSQALASSSVDSQKSLVRHTTTFVGCKELVP